VAAANAAAAGVAGQTQAMLEAQIASAPEEHKQFYRSRHQVMKEITSMSKTLQQLPASPGNAEARKSLTAAIELKQGHVDDTTHLLMADDFGKAYPVFLQLEKSRGEESSVAKRWAAAYDECSKKARVETAMANRVIADAKLASMGLTTAAPSGLHTFMAASTSPAQGMMQAMARHTPAVQSATPYFQPQPATRTRFLPPQTGARPYGTTPAWMTQGQPQQQQQRGPPPPPGERAVFSYDRIAAGEDLRKPVFHNHRAGLRLVSGDGRGLVNINGISNLASPISGQPGPCHFCQGPHISADCGFLRSWFSAGRIEANGHPKARW
jgi:hypothetical protein